MKNKHLGGFSLMEMMVVLLIVAIVLAASAPMVSRRMIRDGGGSGDGECLWTEDTNFIYRDGKVLVGLSEPWNGNDTLDKATLHINRNPGTTAQILLVDKQYDNAAEISYVNKSMGFGSRTALGENSVAIGEGTSINNTNGATAIGSETIVKEKNGIAIGYGAISNSANSIALGSEVEVNGENAVAINGQADGKNNTAIGGGIVTGCENSIAIGNAVEVQGYNSVAIGNNISLKNTNDRGSVLLGFNVDFEGRESFVFGSTNGKSTGMKSIAMLGEFNANQAVAIGQGSKAQADYSVALGDNTTVGTGHINSVAIGRGATTTNQNQIVLGHSGGDFTHSVYIPGSLKVERGITGDVTPLSDRRLKNVGEVFKGGLAELNKLNIYNYTFKNDKNKTPRVGVMAQDLQKVFPAAVIKGEDGFLKIRMEDMFYAVINAIKELDAKISAITEQVKANLDLTAKLQAKIDAQGKEIVELKKQNAEFEKRLAKLEKQACK